MSQALDEATEREAGTPSLRERTALVRERLSEGMRGLIRGASRASEKVAAEAARGRGRAAEAAGGLRRSTPLRHGLAAGERGNLDAALALLLEAVELAPQDAEAVLALWNVALSCEKPELAASAMARWIHAEASSGRRDLAAEHWIELAGRVPQQRVDTPTLVRILPELRQRVSSAVGAEARGEAEVWLRRALRESVAPEALGLTPGLALRILEQARFLDAQSARRAGEIVLAAGDLHETKREHVRALLAQLDAREAERTAARAPQAQQAPTRRAIPVVPVELAARGLIVRESESGQRTRVDLRSIEAIAVARVEGLAAEPVVLIDLVLRRMAEAKERRIVRMRADAFDAGAVLQDSAAGDDPLRGLLGALLDRSGAVPLPDPDGVLIEPRSFASLEAYEEGVLARISTR